MNQHEQCNSNLNSQRAFEGEILRFAQNGGNKLCDAADWFHRDVQEIIQNELRETPRFHRKQWEGAMIFLSLREQGKLDCNKLGLSMGGGKELIAYALAPHTKQLVITDLYEMNTDWDCAKTDDPDDYIKKNKPFPVDDAKLNALRMDMRELKFPDTTFDFCYSTCAVEHIGGREDFLQHFNEVARVLKDDGVYVFTTEVLYGDETIRDEHNYVFSLSLLSEILAESNLALAGEFDAAIAHHKINYPLPSTLKQLSHYGEDGVAQKLIQEAPHIQLLRGKHPFSCALFVLKKRTARSAQMNIVGLDETRRFVETGVGEYRALLDSSRVAVNPFSLLPHERSRFCVDHTDFFAHANQRGDCETPFHTDYFWFGSGKRVFEIALRVNGAHRVGEPTVEFRIHRYKTLSSRTVDCVTHESRSVQRIGWMVRTMEIECDDDSCYAILAKVRGGACVFDKIEVKSYPAHLSRSSTKEPLLIELSATRNHAAP
jgi:SAM-dependent methyltransferase